MSGLPPPVSKIRLDQAEALELATALGCEVSELEELVAEGALDNATPQQAAELLATWWDDAKAFVLAQFRPKPTAASPSGIDAWQEDVLNAVATVARIAMKACKGPGKSCVLAWVIWWFICTRPDSNIVVTSITRENLRDGLWKELAKWYARSPYLQRAFSFTAERIACRGHEATWWCSARGWAKDSDPEQQANTMAGLHGDHVLVVHDEVSDYPDGVIAASEGIFQTEGQEAKLLVAGNPTRQDGPLWRICTIAAKKWSPPRGLTVSITGDPDDPKRSPRISLIESREAIALHGRDNPWVMTNILGLFPKVASDKLLGPDDVLKAIQRTIPARVVKNCVRVMGLDVAWEGDDQSVLTMRQGAAVFQPTSWRDLDDIQLADQVAPLAINLGVARIYVDGVGIGRGVISQLKPRLGGRCEIVDVQAGAEATDKERYLNLRAEMWWTMADAVRKYLALPDHSRLRSDLVGPKTLMSSGGGHIFKQALEPKKKMKARGLPSPDFGDSLAMTFAMADPLPGYGFGNASAHPTNHVTDA